MEDFLRKPIHLNKSRLSALGLLLIVLTLLYFGMVGPLLGMASEYGERADELRFRLQRFQKVAAEKETVLKRLDALHASGGQTENYLNKETAALASADLQSRIKETVNGAGGELTSTQVIPERKEERFTRIAVKVRMNGNTEVLSQVLHGFESETPLLFIENLNIRPIRMPRNPNSKNPAPPERLSVDFDVVGYMRTAE
jgi:general secretion pathway protein M